VTVKSVTRLEVVEVTEEGQQQRRGGSAAMSQLSSLFVGGLDGEGVSEERKGEQ
jgi:hypothetical protein